ncbi:Uma2 family endonuclease [Nocardia sp. NPDC004568]|uniref:Uma2 family endonuclease n=1 Tax=Nocardia sp. NPDC004568 TaxID=3154551 RepID=UPI0033A172B8
MSMPEIERPDLPECLTWEELERLPEEIAAQIELWEGRVVWVRRGPAEHQEYTNLLWAALRRCARATMAQRPERCWRVSTETNIFLGSVGKSDFVTPDFLIYRCLPDEFQDIRARDVLMAGEVLSPSNTQTDIEAKKARYATNGIPWYWEVHLARSPRRIATVRAFVLETAPGQIHDGIRPLYRANYLLADEWAPTNTGAIEIDHPFPVHIPWAELEF